MLTVLINVRSTKWKTTFDGRRPLVKDDLRWIQPLVEDNLWWKTAFGGRIPLGCVQKWFMYKSVVCIKAISGVCISVWY